MAEPTDHIEETPTADELKAFAKTDFYQSWKKRFDKLANLGATGVIATPNTTFDEWLYYFKQWSELYATDYQNFKDMADDAVKSLNNGYKQNKEDYALMASDIQTGFENTSQTMKGIMGDVANLQNRLTKLESDTKPNATLTNNLAIEANQRVAADNELQKQINSTSSEIKNQLSQIKLTPEYFESLTEFKKAYPNGFNGLAVVKQDNTYHAYIYQNNAFRDLGVYQQAAFPVRTHPVGTIDLNNLQNGYDFFTNIENQTNHPDLILLGVAVVVTVRDNANNADQTIYGNQGGSWHRQCWNGVWQNWHSVTGSSKVNPVTDLNNLKANGTYYFNSLNGISNAPSGETGATTVLALNHQPATNSAGQMQIASNDHGKSYIRINVGTWTSWKQINNETSSINSLLNSFSKLTLEPVETTDEVTKGFWSKQNDYANNSNVPVQGLQPISVKPGEMYQIVTGSYYDARNYIIRDAAGNVLDMYPQEYVDGSSYPALETTNIVIPPNAAELLVNRATASGKAAVSKITKIGGSDVNASTIETIASAVDMDGETISTTDYPTKGFWAKIYNGTTYFAALSTPLTALNPINVKPGEIYRFTNSSYFDARNYLVLDHSGQAIKMFPEYSKTGSSYMIPETITVVIPEGGEKLLINRITADGITVKKLTGPSNSKSWARYTWDVIGDSWTAMHSNSFNTYADYIAQRTGITTNYKAVGGTGYIANNGGSSDNFQTRPYDSNADIYTIFGSFNDAWAVTEFGSANSQTSGSLAAAVQATIDKILRANIGAKIGIIAPGPWGIFNPHTNGSIASTSVDNAAEWAEKYVKTLKEMAEYNSIPFLDLYHTSNLKPWNKDFINAYYHGQNSTDETHPNTKGHEIMSYPIQQFIESILK